MQLLIIAVITFYHVLKINSEDVEKRIINGDPVTDDMMIPSSVFIQVFDSTTVSVCGGSLIDPYWVLTAAHCFVDNARDTSYKKKTIKIQAGSPKIEENYVSRPSLPSIPSIFSLFGRGFNLFKNFRMFKRQYIKNSNYPIKRTASRIIIHPEYNSKVLDNDISLVKLDQPIYEIDPMKLPEEASSNLPDQGSSCSLVGWGCTHSNGQSVNRANFLKLNVVSSSWCNYWYHYANGLNKYSEFCAGYYRKNKGICPGDSGSGLICESSLGNYVAGITSATHKNQPEAYPGLFTRVSYFKQWILQSMQRNS